MSKLYVNEIYAKGSSTQAMGIDSSGRVTKPTVPAFRAQKTDGNVSSTNTVLFNDVGLNQGSCYSSSTGKFVAPVHGVYFFGFTGRHNSNNGVIVEIQKNGTRVMSMRSTSTNGTMGNMNLAGTACIELDANDDVKCVVTTQTLWGGTDGEGAVFTGYLIG
jgi:hypothetical protein